jgi:hypothetical protein
MERKSILKGFMLSVVIVLALATMWSKGSANQTIHFTGSSQRAGTKIMPLGDSITFGWPDRSYGGYQHLLGRLLTNDGYPIDFVGSQPNGNEGHPGWTIPQMKNGIDSNGWLKTYQPDIILLSLPRLAPRARFLLWWAAGLPPDGAPTLMPPEGRPARTPRSRRRMPSTPTSRRVVGSLSSALGTKTIGSLGIGVFDAADMAPAFTAVSGNSAESLNMIKEAGLR